MSSQKKAFGSLVLLLCTYRGTPSCEAVSRSFSGQTGASSYRQLPVCCSLSAIQHTVIIELLATITTQQTRAWFTFTAVAFRLSASLYYLPALLAKAGALISLFMMHQHVSLRISSITMPQTFLIKKLTSRRI